MNIEKIREEFETWAEENGYLVLRRAGCGSYHHSSTFYLWIGWQAFRESLVIELPVSAECDDGFSWIDYDETCAVLQASGLKVKP